MKKRGLVSEHLPWMLIAIAILAIVMITISLLKDQGLSLIEKIKNLFTG